MNSRDQQGSGTYGQGYPDQRQDQRQTGSSQGDDWRQQDQFAGGQRSGAGSNYGDWRPSQHQGSRAQGQYGQYGQQGDWENQGQSGSYANQGYGSGYGAGQGGHRQGRRLDEPFGQGRYDSGRGYAGDDRERYASGYASGSGFDSTHDWGTSSVGRGHARDRERWQPAGRDSRDDPFASSYGGYGGGYGGYQGDHQGSFGQGQSGGRQDFHHDPDYLQWRAEQLRNLDNDYHSWREDRYRKFSDEFNQWRSTRSRDEGNSNFGTGHTGNTVASVGTDQPQTSSTGVAGSTIGGSTVSTNPSSKSSKL